MAETTTAAAAELAERLSAAADRFHKVAYAARPGLGYWEQRSLQGQTSATALECLIGYLEAALGQGSPAVSAAGLVELVERALGHALERTTMAAAGGAS
jgi:hypothetical protein